MELRERISNKIDNIVLNKYLGIPIFMLVMYTMFFFAINIGGGLAGVFDNIFKFVFIDGARALLSSMHAPEILEIILVDGIGRGIKTVASFIPIIGILFLFLSIIEDSGYIARVAFTMDGLMKKIGLSGKAFISLIMGFGCSVPAIISTRTMESKRDRAITIAITPFMSCGAKLSVYVLFTSMFFPKNGQNVVFILYIVGILASIFTGLLLKNLIAKEKNSTPILALPSYSLPCIKTILLHAWGKTMLFICNAGKIIVIIITILTVLNLLGTDGSFNNKNTDKTILHQIGKGITPAFAPMGIEKDNWHAVVGIFTGIFAKEVLIGTLDALYQQTNKTMKDAFNGKAGAFAYLLFILLYSPCITVITTIYHELNALWAFTIVFWNTLLAYSAATLFYQVATISSHFMSSMLWIIGILAFYIIGFMLLKKWSNKYSESELSKKLGLNNSFPNCSKCSKCFYNI